MKINKILILSVIVLTAFAGNNLRGETGIYDYTGENMLSLISPLGRAEYNNLGVVDLKGVKVNLITLKYEVLFIESADKIYSDPESLLPYRIERTIPTL